MIIQTGMRTDIPAFYAEWFRNRLAAGFVCVRNPFNPRSVARYDLSPNAVDLIGFCTKNPAPMLPHLPLLKPYGQHWFVTITGYGKEIEPNVPAKTIVLRDFQRLSEAVGPNAVAWRYDPIFLSPRYTTEFHFETFEKFAAALAGYTRDVVISFIDLYQKVKRNFPEAREVDPLQRLAIGKELIRIAAVYGMTVRPCGEGDELAAFGADCGGCMTAATYECVLGKRLNIPKSDRKRIRAECACLLGNDIGAYDSCAHFCRYCYANARIEAVKANRKLHDPNSPLLIGHIQPDDRVYQAKQTKWAGAQLDFGLF